jgi:hypothetical protein
VEERRDGTLAFIHVSVKDFVQASSSNLVIREEEVLQQHATAVLACLISGLDVFSGGFAESLQASRVIKGIHGLHIYATEYWTEYLLSEVTRHGGSSDNCVFRLARQLANKLESLVPSDVQRGDSDPGHFDDRLFLLGQDETLQKHVKRSLESRTMEKLERELQNNQRDIAQASDSPDGILTMLTAYQKCVRSILSQHDFPGISAEELELFKRQFHTSAFTCRLKSCPRATVGFDSAQLLRQHELSHVCRLRCASPGCHYPPFPSAQALRRHEQRVHQQTPAPRPIRRVGNFGQGQSVRPLQQRVYSEEELTYKMELDLKTRNMTTGDDTLRTQKNDLQTHPGGPPPLLPFPRYPATLPLPPEDRGPWPAPRPPLRTALRPLSSPSLPLMLTPQTKEEGGHETSLLAVNSVEQSGNPSPQTRNNGQTNYQVFRKKRAAPESLDLPFSHQDPDLADRLEREYDIPWFSRP